jgi:hypothetical protein
MNEFSMKDRDLADLPQGAVHVIEDIYYIPTWSKLLQECLPCDIDNVVRLYAIDQGWIIGHTAMTIANDLGLSTQIPGRYVYYSDGPACVIKIDNTEIEFIHKAFAVLNKDHTTAFIVTCLIYFYNDSVKDHKAIINDWFSEYDSASDLSYQEFLELVKPYPEIYQNALLLD